MKLRSSAIRPFPLALALAGAACGPSPSAVRARPAEVPITDPIPPASGVAHDGAFTDGGATLAQHQALLAAALARVPAIAATVSDIRGLPLKHPVPAEAQGPEAFRQYLDREVKKDMPPEKSAQSVRALVRLGLLKESIDMGKTVEDAMLSQAGAYYDPETKKFYVVIVPDDESMLDVMSAHELTHALDDQYFDLGAYTDDPKHELSNDVEQARRCVVEGEATLIMLAYQAKIAGHVDIFDPAAKPMEQALVRTFAALDSEELAKSAADNPATLAQMGPSMKASIDAMSSIPPFILDPLFGAYTKGAAAVAAVRDAGGWDAVGALYTSAPESTEQILHPMEKLIGKRDRPVQITFAALPKLFADKTPLDTDVVGELTMAVYFKNWGDKTPAVEVTGWGGDRYTAFDVDGTVVAVWFTTWDTEKDASRFAKAYGATLSARFPGEHPVLHGDLGMVEHADHSETAFMRSGRDVTILDGFPTSVPADVRAWLAKTKKTQAK